MSDILQRIFAVKREELASARARAPLATLRRQAETPRDTGDRRGFAASLARRIDSGRSAVIAEVKRASPSKGVLRDPFDPAAIAHSYERH
ncbi:MAG: indole-3-glycerol-phosphate synthase TrpC, partial [Rubrivivax sp.]